jgi:hypothetical protein
MKRSSSSRGWLLVGDGSSPSGGITAGGAVAMRHVHPADRLAAALLELPCQALADLPRRLLIWLQ